MFSWKLLLQLHVSFLFFCSSRGQIRRNVPLHIAENLHRDPFPTFREVRNNLHEEERTQHDLPNEENTQTNPLFRNGLPQFQSTIAHQTLGFQDSNVRRQNHLGKLFFHPFGDAPQVQPDFNSLRFESNDVSPFWADPQGRSSPPPPHLTIDMFQNTRTPCSNESLVPCDPFSPYRTIDGSCNNLNFPTYGRSNTVLQRMLPKHSDAATLMRIRSTNGGLLPNPRVISDSLRGIRSRLNNNRNLNLLYVMFGQFIDHDMVITPVAEDPDNAGKELRCSECDSWTKHPSCAPINIPEGDPLSQGSERGCMSFTRSVGKAVVADDGQFRLENINLNTAYLDLSTVYGSTTCLQTQLRTFKEGKLHATHTTGSVYGLPVLTPSSHFTACRTKFKQCYLAGDERSNEHIGLLVLHTLFLREHNTLAREMKRINPTWSDEKIYQEARRLNIAQYQHIIFNEFLPNVLPDVPMFDIYSLIPHPSPVASQFYRSNVNGQIMEEFATAAFRFGHSLVGSSLTVADEHLLPLMTVPLEKVFNDPSIMQETMEGTMVDGIIRGLLSVRMEEPDLHLTTALRDKLFASRSNTLGQDLFARNVARGRDHGLAPYSHYRAPCRLRPITSWGDMTPDIPRETVNVLRTIYQHWDDVDLFVGGLAEVPLEGGLVGPTFGCIIALQFYISRGSDRFWYSSVTSGFSQEQLQQIYQNGRLSGVVSRNLDNDRSLVPDDAFRIPTTVDNAMVEASSLKFMDLLSWSDPLSDRPKTCPFKDRVYAPGAPVDLSPCLECVCTGQGYLHCKETEVNCPFLGEFLDSNPEEYCQRVCERPGPLGPLGQQIGFGAHPFGQRQSQAPDSGPVGPQRGQIEPGSGPIGQVRPQRGQVGPQRGSLGPQRGQVSSDHPLLTL